MTNTSCALRLPARPAGELIDLTEVRCRLSARAEEGSLAGVAVVSALFGQEDVEAAARELRVLAEKIAR